MKTAGRSTAITDIEMAFKIAPARGLTRKDTAGIDRVYFGHELCERLLPSPEQLRRALKAVRGGRKRFSLLTPSATEYGLRDIRPLVALLGEGDEVVANDYGVLHMVQSEFGNPVVVGRVLGRIVLPALAALRGDDSSFRGYLSLLGNRVAGVEADYFNAPLVDEFLARRIAVSLYTGPLVWTTTRRCAFNSRARRLHKFCMCRQECLSNEAVIENTAAGREFLLKGNAVFGLNRSVQTTSQHSLFRRIVFEPPA